jgi:hypothetical protein
MFAGYRIADRDFSKSEVVNAIARNKPRENWKFCRSPTGWMSGPPQLLHQPLSRMPADCASSSPCADRHRLDSPGSYRASAKALTERRDLVLDAALRATAWPRCLQEADSERSASAQDRTIAWTSRPRAGRSPFSVRRDECQPRSRLPFGIVMSASTRGQEGSKVESF